jgi:hypothetical protein
LSARDDLGRAGAARLVSWASPVRLLATILAGMVVAAPPARAEPALEPEASRVGVRADVGVPDGLMTSLAVRVLPMLDAHAGLGTNANSLGARIGARLSPIAAVVAPYLALEGGGFLEAETPDWMRSTAKKAGLDDKTLTMVGYRFANLHLGARIGGGTTTFYAQGGVSFVSATTGIIKPKPNYEPPVELHRETVVHVWFLAGHLGVEHAF